MLCGEVASSVCPQLMFTGNLQEKTRLKSRIHTWYGYIFKTNLNRQLFFFDWIVKTRIDMRVSEMVTHYKLIELYAGSY